VDGFCLKMGFIHYNVELIAALDFAFKNANISHAMCPQRVAISTID
jgi:hypothetical protein